MQSLKTFLQKKKCWWFPPSLQADYARMLFIMQTESISLFLFSGIVLFETDICEKCVTVSLLGLQ
jgi:hypothetical protein